MARRPEPAEAAPPPSRKRRAEEEDEESAQSEEAPHSRLKPILHYAMLGFAPFVAVLALILAALALGKVHTMQALLDTTNASLNQANAALSISQLQLKKLESAEVPEKAAYEAAEKKQDELTAKIIQNLTPLQTKLKIHPTLEEQLNPPASAVPAAPVAAAAPVPAAQKPEPKKPEPKPKKPEPKQSPQVKSMLDAIHKFNEQ
jgi:hypothetical protein